jgi:hypothetical protein
MNAASKPPPVMTVAEFLDLQLPGDASLGCIDSWSLALTALELHVRQRHRLINTTAPNLRMPG